MTAYIRTSISIATVLIFTAVNSGDSQAEVFRNLRLLVDTRGEVETPNEMKVYDGQTTLHVLQAGQKLDLVET